MNPTRTPRSLHGVEIAVEEERSRDNLRCRGICLRVLGGGFYLMLRGDLVKINGPSSG